MDKELITSEKEMDAKIKQLEEFQEEMQCFIISLEQMHESAVNVYKEIIKWRNKNEQ